MDRLRAARLAILGAATAALLAGPGVAPAGAHNHPQAPFADEPAVVYLQTAVDASIDQTQKTGSNVVTTNVHRTFVLATGSGFTVNGDGTIVTVNAAVPTTVRPGDLGAINQALSKDYGITLPASAFATGTRVRACTPDHGTCVAFSDPVIRVFPFVSPALKQGLAASVLKAGGAASDVAVIKVGGNGNMPAVNLAASVSNLAAFTVLGFPDVPNGQAPPVGIAGHYKPAGSHTIDPADLPKVKAALRPGLRGGPLVDDSGRVVGLISDLGGGAGFGMKDLAAVHAALQAAGASAAQGPVDTAFQSAASFFLARHYTPAVPGFRQVLQLYPSHALAQQDLRAASAKAGGPEDLHGKEDLMGGVDTSESGSQRPLGLWLGTGGGVLLLGVLALGVLLRRRRRGQEPAQVGPPAIAARPRPPVSGSAVAPVPSAGAGPPVAGGGPGPGGSARRSFPGAISRLTQRPLRSATPPRDGSLPGPVGPFPPGPAGHAPRPVSMTPAGAAPGTGAVPGGTRSEGRAQPAFCTRCGGPLAPRHRFCGFCGNAVNANQ